MKKMILLTGLLLFAVTNVYSQLLDENFEYPAGDSLGAHDWITFSGGSVNRIMVTSPGLIFNNYSGSGIGNSATLTNSGQDIYKNFISAKDTLSLYISFMVNVISARSGDYFLSLLPSTSTNLFTGRVYAKDSSGTLAFGLSKTTAAAGGIFYTPSVYNYNTTYLILLKYTFNETGNSDDQVSLFVFNSIVPSIEPSPAIGPISGTGADLNDAGRIALRQGTASSSPDVIIDGIFAATSWDNNALPVELVYFLSNVVNRDVRLNWSTVSEVNNYGFEIERSSINGQWEKIGFKAGHGTTGELNNYEFTDKNLMPGDYHYRLRQIDYNGNFENFLLINEIKINFPQRFILRQNYPNPFNPSTMIDYELPEEGNVKLIIFDITGKEIKTLVNSFQQKGVYKVSFNLNDIGSTIPSGLYFYKLSVESGTRNFQSTRKMLILK